MRPEDESWRARVVAGMKNGHRRTGWKIWVLVVEIAKMCNP